MKSDELVLQISGVADLRDEVSKLRKSVDALILEIQRERNKPQITEQRYLSLRGMQKYTGLSPNTILKYFTPAKLEGKLLFDKLAVDAILKSCVPASQEDEFQRFRSRMDSMVSKAS